MLPILFLQCSVNKECQLPSSALWMIETKDSSYCEFYWDSYSNYFFFDGFTGDANVLENDTVVSSFYMSLLQKPCNEKEKTMEFIKEYTGYEINSINLIGRYIYLIDSNKVNNFLLFNTEAHLRYERMYNNSNSSLSDTTILIEELILPDKK